MSDIKSFEIRTVQDIYNLPTIEQIEACLDELRVGMLQARTINDSVMAVVETQGIKTTRAIEWPEFFTWRDDSKHEISVTINDPIDQTELITIRSKLDAEAVK